MVSPPSAFSPGEILVIRAGDRRLALPLACVREIVPMCALAHPPSAPSLLLGLLNLGGKLVPVLKLALLLGLPETRAGLHTPLVVVETDGTVFALLVQSVEEVRQPQAEEWTPVDRTHAFNACVTASVSTANGAVEVLNPTRLLLEQERNALTEFTATRRGRLQNLAEARA